MREELSAEPPDSTATDDLAEGDSPQESPPDEVSAAVNVAAVAAPPPPEAPADDTARHLRALEVTLRKTRARWLQPLFIEVALWCAVALGAAVLTALLTAALFPGAAHLASPALLGAALCGVVGAVITALYQLVWRRPDELEMARRLQESAPWLRNDLVAALRFARALADGSFDEARSSASLARLHVSRTTRRVMERAEEGHLGAALPARDLKPALWTCGGVALALLIPALFAPEWVAQSLVGAAQEAAAESQRASVATRPILGNLSLLLTPPSYTQLPPEQLLFSSGHVKVVEGTQITLQGYLLPASVKRMELKVSAEATGAREAQTLQLPMELADSGRASGVFVADGPLTYTFRALLEEGTWIEDPMERRVEVVPDQAPRVGLVSHRGELEVSPQDVLELELAVEDDFGITRISRLHAFVEGDEPTRVALDLPQLQSAPSSFNGKVVLDLAALNLQPRDRVTLTFEAEDTNTLSGPGVGVSEPLVLCVASPDDKHLKNLAAQRELVEAMLETLADYLEAPIGERVANARGDWSQRVEATLRAPERSARRAALYAAHQRADVLLRAIGALSADLKQDPLMVQRDLNMFVALHEQLDKLHVRGDRLLKQSGDAALLNELSSRQMQGLADWAAENEEAYEKGILRLEDLLFAQQTANVQATMDEIKELRDRLKELLQRYKETGDPEVKEAIKREMQRMRSRMQELMARIQQQVKELPAEHVNREALEQARMERDSAKAAQDFNSIEDLLDKDDIDGALEALERMGQELDKMSAEMGASMARAQPEALSEFDKQVGELMDEVNDLDQLQQNLAQETEQLQRELQQTERAQTERQLDALAQRLKEQVEAQQRAAESLDAEQLPRPVREAREEAQRELGKLKEALESRDAEASLEHAQNAQRELEEMDLQMRQAQRFMERQDPRARSMSEAQRAVRPMTERGEQIVQEIEQVMEEARGQGQRQDPRAQELAKKQRQVQLRAQQAQHKIEEAGRQFPTLKEQVGEPMERARRSMEEAGKGLEGQRMQQALDSERQAIEQLRQLKDAMRQSVERERNRAEKEGGQEVSREKVTLPKNTQRAPSYRDLLEEGMKEGKLEDYESDIDSYYKSLGQQ